MIAVGRNRGTPVWRSFKRRSQSAAGGRAPGGGSGSPAIPAVMAKPAFIVLSGNSADLIDIAKRRFKGRAKQDGYSDATTGDQVRHFLRFELGGSSTKRPPKGKPFASYEVWTGEMWSAASGDATIFDSLGDADQYVKENYARRVPSDRSRANRPVVPRRSICQSPDLGRFIQPFRPERAGAAAAAGQFGGRHSQRATPSRATSGWQRSDDFIGPPVR